MNPLQPHNRDSIEEIKDQRERPISQMERDVTHVAQSVVGNRGESDQAPLDLKERDITRELSLKQSLDQTFAELKAECNRPNKTEEEKEKIVNEMIEFNENIVFFQQLYGNLEKEDAEEVKGIAKIFLVIKKFFSNIFGISPQQVLGQILKKVAAELAKMTDPPPSSKKVIGGPGLPNMTKGLVNVCYMNSAIQIIKNIPGLTELVKNAVPKEEATPLKKSLVDLLNTMDNPSSSKKAIVDKSEAFWNQLQGLLKNSEKKCGLTPGKGKTNDSSEFMTFLAETLNIAPLENILSNSFYLLSKEFSSSLEGGNEEFFIGSIEGKNPEISDTLSIRGNDFVLKGVIKYFWPGHYTSMVKVKDQGKDQWINYNDMNKRLLGPKGGFGNASVLIYEKVQSKGNDSKKEDSKTIESKLSEGGEISLDQTVNNPTKTNEPIGVSSWANELLDHEEFVIKGLASGDFDYSSISNRLKKSKEIALAFVKSNGLNLPKLSKEMQEDVEIARAAVAQNYASLRYVKDQALKNFLKGEFDVSIQRLAAVTDLQNNKEYLLKVIEKDPEGLEYASEELKKDPEIIQKIIQMAMKQKK
jgi:hypothetical protein